jgi:CubicO group peptidase (beta-lactamase class C family)
MRLLLLVLIAALNIHVLCAQGVIPKTDNRQKNTVDVTVHKYVLDYLKHEGTIGLSIGLIVGGKTYRYNYGELEKGKGNLPNAESLYCFGSVGKTFVGILLAQAILEKKIDLNDDVRKYLPVGSQYKNLEFQGMPIRVVHLSNHTSLIPNSITPFPDNWNNSTADERYLFKKDYDEKTFLSNLKNVIITEPPGSKYLYSGAAVRLLAIILEAVYKKPYTTLFQEYYVKKIGMRKTKIISSKDDWRNFAVGDQNRDELIRTRSGFDDLTSAPGGVSTIDDMLTYLKFNYAEKNLAARLSHQKTWEGGSRQLGLVWRLETDDLGQKRLFHTGRGLRNQCSVLFYPGKKIALVVFTNDAIADSHLDELCSKILHDINSRSN